MTNAAFDTLSMAQRLERDFDFPPKQAEGTAMLLHEHIVGNTVSKEDFSAFVKSNEARFDAFEKTVEARFDAFEKSNEARFDAFEKSNEARFDAFEKSNEARFEGIEARFEGIEARFEGIDARFKEAEAKDDARIAEVRNDLKWIKIIGAVIVAATVTPWLTELLSPLFK